MVFYTMSVENTGHKTVPDIAMEKSVPQTFCLEGSMLTQLGCGANQVWSSHMALMMDSEEKDKVVCSIISVWCAALLQHFPRNPSEFWKH